MMQEMAALDEGLKAIIEGFRPAFDSTIELVKENMSYEIVDYKEENGNGIITVKLTCPDSSIDFAAVVRDAISEYFTVEKMNELAEKLAKEGRYNQNTTQEEANAMMFEAMIPPVQEKIKSNSVAKTEMEMKLVVKESDGKFVIDVVQSELD